MDVQVFLFSFVDQRNYFIFFGERMGIILMDVFFYGRKKQVWRRSIFLKVKDGGEER